MMGQDDLTSSLYADQVDPDELALVALEVLGAGAYEAAVKVVYHWSGDLPALHFVFKENELRMITAGPGLTSDDLSRLQTKIRKDILDLDRKIVGRMILFSAYPVTGCLRIGEFLQICPVPIHAPRPKDPGEGHEWSKARAIRWSKFSSDQYEKVILNVRKALGRNVPLWEVEQYWRGYQRRHR